MAKSVDIEKQQRLGKRLRKIREEKNLSQEDVAKVAGMAPGYYARIERGKHAPSTLMLEKICKALKIRASEILFF